MRSASALSKALQKKMDASLFCASANRGNSTQRSRRVSLLRKSFLRRLATGLLLRSFTGSHCWNYTTTLCLAKLAKTESLKGETHNAPPQDHVFVNDSAKGNHGERFDPPC